ncbi:HAD-IIIA family hydrolase [Arcicella sp. LKC2W]|uniref:KdsC family phosphatase n=1 Tax=Arcicella sp. LKC2W TaxID=2984198 RepID=UPI002B201A4F|nr:HAD-IIIA family hydrolase [Arcicella sp. LKC2W]MEA5460798.1 HAD-IIIA family hydrolase [Arcicella sp. LKC2W]
MTEEILSKARKIKLLITDCDGVLTDGSVYYGEQGEILKKFNIRDGMGVERLRKLADVQTGIITGEVSPSVVKRAEKLQITELHLGIKDKLKVLMQIMVNKNLTTDDIAYIGDDVNDIEIMQQVGLTACPADAISFTKNIADYICESKGGEGCFREFAELIIASKI